MARRVAQFRRRIKAPGGCPGFLSNNQTILGIDPGLDRTGYAVVSLPAARVVDAGVIRSSARLPLARRLNELNAGVNEILAEHHVDIVAVEDLFAHYAHPRTAILMGHARGVVLLAAASRGIDVISLLPTRIKKSLTGNGHAGKLQMQRAIMATLNLSRLPEPPDVADALAIAWCAGVASAVSADGVSNGPRGRGIGWRKNLPSRVDSGPDFMRSRQSRALA